MLSKLDIVKGAVAKKDFLPVLKHLRIANGWITSTNGRLTISTPLPEMSELDLTVPADKFIQAIQVCKKPKFKITEKEKLSIVSTEGNKHRILLPLLRDINFPTPDIVGEEASADNLSELLLTLKPFIGNDASRPWACGVLLHKGMAYATNNIVIARIEAHWTGPTINIPDFLVEELLRLKRKPVKILTDGSSITLQLEDDIWINSALLPTDWPNADELFNKVDFSEIKEIPGELYQAIHDIIPFCPDPKFPRILFTEDSVTTDAGDHEAKVDFSGLSKSIWRAEPLLQMLGQGGGKSSIYGDFSQWPGACPWVSSNGLQGLIIGLKQ